MACVGVRRLGCPAKCVGCLTHATAARFLKDPTKWNGRRRAIWDLCRTTSCNHTGILGRPAVCRALQGLDEYAKDYLDQVPKDGPLAALALVPLRFHPDGDTYEAVAKSCNPTGVGLAPNMFRFRPVARAG